MHIYWRLQKGRPKGVVFEQRRPLIPAAWILLSPCRLVDFRHVLLSAAVSSPISFQLAIPAARNCSRLPACDCLRRLVVSTLDPMIARADLRRGHAMPRLLACDHCLPLLIETADCVDWIGCKRNRIGFARILVLSVLTGCNEIKTRLPREGCLLRCRRPAT
jgi:hypothetical protein